MFFNDILNYYNFLIDFIEITLNFIKNYKNLLKKIMIINYIKISINISPL